MEVNQITGKILDVCIKIHKDLGPGLFENVYEQILYRELLEIGFQVERQKGLPVIYEEYKFEEGYRIDLIIENKVILEIKSIETLAPVHFKQLHTYLRLANIKDGILINFNVDLIKDGFHRVFNNFVK